MDDAPIRIGELARRTGVSADTIRHYERLGLLPRPARTRAGYRQYAPSIVQRVRLVRHGLRFGFTLRELAGFLNVRTGGARPCSDVRASGGRIMAAVDTQIAELKATRRAMRGILEDWDRRLAGTPSDQRAHLLEHLDGVAAIPAPSPRRGLKTGHPRSARA